MINKRKDFWLHIGNKKKCCLLSKNDLHHQEIFIKKNLCSFVKKLLHSFDWEWLDLVSNYNFDRVDQRGNFFECLPLACRWWRSTWLSKVDSKSPFLSKGNQQKPYLAQDETTYCGKDFRKLTHVDCLGGNNDECFF